MGLPNPFKLERLKVRAFSDPKRTAAVGSFEAMFNPSSVSMSNEIEYEAGAGEGGLVKYKESKPSTLGLKLVLDGSGVNVIGSPLRPSKTVAERVQQFLDLAFKVSGDIHEPNYLRVEWGDIIYPCRLSSVDVTYTSFNRDGTAARAELDVKFLADEHLIKHLSRLRLTSPDLTHSRVVRQGDTLPQLCRSVYGTPDKYLLVARKNALDDFRDLAPGRVLVFPPLET